MKNVLFALLIMTIFIGCENCPLDFVKKYPAEYIHVGMGFAGNSINSSIFRHHAIYSFNDKQYLAYYDVNGQIIFARRNHGSSTWEKYSTGMYGRINDAHNVISFGFDKDGFIHLCYGMHGDSLIYHQSLEPENLSEFTDKLSMTTLNETRVTYPQFVNSPDGSLYFFYRDGQSGNGNLIINKYNDQNRYWDRLATNIIDGEGERNPYWMNPVFSPAGTLHLSWVWRETGDASTNHDICYAFTYDDGKTWFKSDNTQYKQLPITQKNAEIIYGIPQNSNLINQCSMALDSRGLAHIAYYRNDENEIPQYFHLRFDGNHWYNYQITQRTIPFTLGGIGTKYLMISRPQIAITKENLVCVIYRDWETGGQVRVAQSEFPYSKWSNFDIYNENMVAWEPNFDKSLWDMKNVLHLFYQVEFNGPSDGSDNYGQGVAQSKVGVLEYSP